jgi:hypothetical protein
LLSKDELKTILTPEEADTLRAELRRRKIEFIDAKSLVGKWVDIEGRGPGLIQEYAKVFAVTHWFCAHPETNVRFLNSQVSISLLFDSMHKVDFTISGGFPKTPVLLRRRKLLRWNNGARFHLLDKKPSPQVALSRFCLEFVRKLFKFYQSFSDVGSTRTRHALFWGGISVRGAVDGGRRGEPSWTPSSEKVEPSVAQGGRF